MGGAPFELARIIGTSVAMIERSSGKLVAGASEGTAARLPAAIVIQRDAEAGSSVQPSS